VATTIKIPKKLKNTLNLHHCINYTQVRVLECLLRQIALHFTACLLTNSSSDVNIRAKWRCILPNITCIFLNVGRKCWVSLLSYQRGFSKSGLTALDIHIGCHITYTWLSTYDRKSCHKTTRSFPVTTFFSLWTPSFYQEMFLMHIVRREIAIHSWTKGVALCTVVILQHALQPSLYICHRKQRHKSKNITSSDNFHTTFHSSYLLANKSCMLWWWLIIYAKSNLQKSDSNVHLVLYHTKNALVKSKSNSLATVNATWAHFIMVSQKVIM
jgi:hypothetical protein